jgi:hypothetical protein
MKIGTWKKFSWQILTSDENVPLNPLSEELCPPPLLMGELLTINGYHITVHPLTTFVKPYNLCDPPVSSSVANIIIGQTLMLSMCYIFGVTVMHLVCQLNKVNVV